MKMEIFMGGLPRGAGKPFAQSSFTIVFNYVHCSPSVVVH